MQTRLSDRGGYLLPEDFRMLGCNRGNSIMCGAPISEPPDSVGACGAISIYISMLGCYARPGLALHVQPLEVFGDRLHVAGEYRRRIRADMKMFEKVWRL